MNYLLLAPFAFALLSATIATAGTSAHDYKVLPAITKSNLSLFPIVGGAELNTAAFLTLDEGLRSGQVVITETGTTTTPLVRPSPHYPLPNPSGQVNRLALLNNSDRPLLLLAGEVVTGGKQDRVIGVDGIVPPKSEPVDRLASREFAAAAPAASAALAGTSSYATVMQNPEVEKRVAFVAADYDGLLRELRKVGAKGVVVAINGQITWADVFASTSLLEKYWQKLIRSYAAESLTNAGSSGDVDQKQAQAFLDLLQGTREVTETEPGVFRRTEISGDGYKVFTLSSLLPKAEYTVHMAKMSYEQTASRNVRPLLRRP